MYPLKYIEPVFRPPSEWKSLILQVTNGCSWNNCTFCDMYTQEQKKFKPKKLEDIEQELMAIKRSGMPVQRIFLADGDALTLPFRRLKEICELINQTFPDVQRISSYCLPRNLTNKTVEQLQELQQLKLSLVYIGCESGDDEVLELIEKGETFDSSKVALDKLQQAGIKRSVMILNGLGGKEFSEQHAINSAKLMNQTQPEYLSTLVVSFPLGQERFAKKFTNGFELPNQLGLFKEMETLLTHLELDKTIFRSDHASNYLVLKGILGKDKQALLAQVQTAINTPNMIPLREEWQRGL
ncbi:radical SAM protein [Psychrosphaera saromensis]|uniref:Radical SAM protein n=1 Tax=Psychrosphaera saromensis TaxID=716813 RepID=A0A2S7UVP6_9GAMM|nr:radical SAM protein [Psychrosphaera saromensis]PQJ54066.1 radical SAM protein [Psychrosphaera saromensis]GHB76567.1 radical SAM protein [Psychrosphaera saromensis]GLQ14436.1 radical SAM protein [Psychrosphaera saromensis]